MSKAEALIAVDVQFRLRPRSFEQKSFYVLHRRHQQDSRLDKSEDQVDKDAM